jgi:hypothetical protein
MHQSSSASTAAKEAVSQALSEVHQLSVTTSAVLVHFSASIGDTLGAAEAKARLASLQASERATLSEDASVVDTKPRSSSSSSS